jgi:hypothetical protein
MKLREFKSLTCLPGLPTCFRARVVLSHPACIEQMMPCEAVARGKNTLVLVAGAAVSRPLGERIRRGRAHPGLLWTGGRF